MPRLTAHAIPNELLSALRAARHVLVFTGAGVSAASGIATFRDPLSGLWERFDPADLATASGFRKDRELVWGWYEWRRMKVLQAQANPAHLAIAELARHVPRLTVVTQNVDDLHERAGSTDVLHLHGSLHSPRCFACSRPFAFPPGVPDEPPGGRRLCPPQCGHCGAYIRPGVVWFGESLPEDVLEQAFAAARECDLLFAIGTSGIVQPAAGIPVLARKAGAKLVQINPTATQLDAVCTWSLRAGAAMIMPDVLRTAFPLS